MPSSANHLPGGRRDRPRRIDRHNVEQDVSGLQDRRESGDGHDSNGQAPIKLTPCNNPDTTGQVAVYNNGGTTADFSSLSVKNPTAVIINTPWRLSVSEPLTTPPYPDADSQGGMYTATGGYPMPYDVPRELV